MSTIINTVKGIVCIRRVYGVRHWRHLDMETIYHRTVYLTVLGSLPKFTVDEL